MNGVRSEEKAEACWHDRPITDWCPECWIISRNTPDQKRALIAERRAAYLRRLPTYQRYDAMALVREAAALIAEPGQRVIYRDAFRWKDHATNHVLPNHYESKCLDSLADEFGYDIVHDFGHVAVVR